VNTDIVTLAQLKAGGFSIEDVRRECPGAVERVALDGSPCWLAKDLRPLLGEGADE
jgi:hypothetical protein